MNQLRKGLRLNSVENTRPNDEVVNLRALELPSLPVRIYLLLFAQALPYNDMVVYQNS